MHFVSKQQQLVSFRVLFVCSLQSKPVDLCLQTTRREEAAVVLQCSARSSSAKRTLVCLQVQQAKRVEAAAIIQSGVRSLFARKAYHLDRTEWMSTAIMQRAAQVFLAKKISFALKVEKSMQHWLTSVHSVLTLPGELCAACNKNTVPKKKERD